MLLCYRFLTFLWCAGVAAHQFVDKGFYIFKYYTVWYVNNPVLLQTFMLTQYMLLLVDHACM